MNANELRRAFTDFFAARGHTVVPSSSLIPTHPTAPMFVNSGMMPFVPYFLGEEPVPADRNGAGVLNIDRANNRRSLPRNVRGRLGLCR